MGGNPFMQFVTSTGKSLRITGIAFVEDASSGAEGTGNLVIGGSSTSVRVDHCHFLIFIGGSKGLGLINSVTGVADHLYINTTQGVTNDFVFLNGGNWNGDTDPNSLGDASWTDTDHFGSAQFFYVEDTRLVGGYMSDCSNGGRYVFRHMTAIGTNGMANHGTHDPWRGCRAAEVYQSTFDDTTSGANGGSVEPVNSGPALVWGNTVTKFRFLVGLSIVRQSNATYGQVAPPSGWGYCGNTQTGSTSSWDQNSTTNGYACLDQPGRGAGDLLAGYPQASIVNASQSNTRVWPRQVLDPVYVWNNTYNDAGYSPEGLVGDTTGILSDNKDYYQQFLATYGESGSFNGTAGIGQGLLSARTSTCTTGVGYWATDTTTLYTCNTTNTWTTYYTPYTYPHPLTLGPAGPGCSIF
jgi:hypothetical protein